MKNSPFVWQWIAIMFNLLASALWVYVKKYSLAIFFFGMFLWSLANYVIFMEG